MNRITDEQLDALLMKYHKIEPSAIPAFIPPTQPKPAVILLFKKPRVLAAAASVVLTVALGFSLFFLFRNKQPIPVAPTIPSVSTEQPSAAAPSPAPSPTAQPTDNPPTPATAPNIAPATQPATDAEGTITVITITTTQTSVDQTDPTDTAIPSTESPSSSSGDSDAQAQANGSGDAVPAGLPDGTAPATDWRWLEIRLPYSELDMNTEEDFVAGNIPDLYCSVYDSSGSLLGDPDPFNHHLMLCDENSDATDRYLFYSIDYDARLITDHRFTYRIYDADGRVYKTGSVKA